MSVSPPADEIAAELCRTRAERQMRGERTRVSDDAGALAVWLAGRAASVGVTSSDERAPGDPDYVCEPCVRGDGGTCDTPGCSRWGLKASDPVPSSDEPEGAKHSALIAIDGMADPYVRAAVAQALGGLLKKIPGLARGFSVGTNEAGATVSFRTLPAPVGDAEPVAWKITGGTSIPDPSWTEDALWAADCDMGGCTVTAFGRLPVSSQDAGAGWAFCDRCGGKLGDSAHGTLECYGCDREKRAVDLVLPAEGARRTDLIEAATRAVSDQVWECVPDRDRFAIQERAVRAYDALRAAAGKAGSDDA